MPIALSREVKSLTEELCVLKNFPFLPPQAKVRVAKIIAGLCQDLGQAESLVAAMLDRYNEWPGPAALREAYLDLYHPANRLWEPPAWQRHSHG